MPNRIIKDSIHSSDTCNAMTDFQFRLWVSLITYVDDYGRGDARPAIIKGTCFPLRERMTTKDIEAGLAGLAGLGCIGLYEVDGRSYLYFPTWEKHQSVRNKKSRFPAPPDNLQKVESNCDQLSANVPVIQSESNPNPNPNPNPKNKRASAFVPPTLEEVIAYCKERNSTVDPKQFYEYFQVGNWIDSKGHKVKNWKQKLLTWEKFQPKKSQPSGREALEELYAEARATESRGELPEWVFQT